MHHSYLAFAIPLFLFFIGLEYYYSKKKNKNFFHFAESVANLNVGIAERLTDVFTIVPFYYFFEYIHLNFRIFNITGSAFTWVLLFLFTDFIWYWYHRFAHEINFLWAAHIVHHQSEDFNFTTSARITVFQASIRCLFWGVLPLIGFDPAMIAIFLLIHGIFPFFIHTQTIGKLGIIEKLFVTPSHHRVHHSSNPQYLDKNYGDVFIIWDKMFGTFVEENEQPIYGLTKPIKSYSFLWQHFHYPLEIYFAAKKSKGIKNKLKIIFGSPATLDPSIRVYLERYFLTKKVFLKPTSVHKSYIIGQTILSLSLLFCLIFFYNNLTTLTVAFLSLFILLSIINTGAILEQQSWIFYLENIRIFICMLFCWLKFPNGFLLLIIFSFSVLIVYYFKKFERGYKRILFTQS